MKTSESINDIAAALAKAQGQFVNPSRNRDVEVSMKTGGKYSFSYATLDGILDMCRKPLSDNGLGIVHALSTDEQGPICETRLLHASGQWIETAVPIIVADNANAQAWGGAITYARRYGICALLSIAADEDDDANQAVGNTTAPRTGRQSAKSKPKPETGLGENGQPTSAEEIARKVFANSTSEQTIVNMATAVNANAEGQYNAIAQASLLADAARALRDLAVKRLNEIKDPERREKAAVYYAAVPDWLLPPDVTAEIATMFRRPAE